MIITTERLPYLWAVAETGSFAAAGRIVWRVVAVPPIP